MACRLIRECGRQAFALHGRSMVASDLIPHIHQAFEDIFNWLHRFKRRACCLPSEFCVQRPALLCRCGTSLARDSGLASCRKVQRKQHGELPQAFGARTTKQNKKTCETKRQAVSLKRNNARLSSLCRNCMVVCRLVAYFMFRTLLLSGTLQRRNVWVIIISLHARLIELLVCF